MKNPDLPDDILRRIIETVAADDYARLGGFIRAGKGTNEMVFSKKVLSTVNVFPMFWKNYRDFEPRGRCRIFWEKSLAQLNLEVVYFERLRIAIHDGEVYGATYLLEAIIPSDPRATLAAAMLCVCLGETAQASQLFREFTSHYAPLHSEYARLIGDAVKEDIFWFNPPYGSSLEYSFLYPDDEFVQKPECVSEDCGYGERYCNMCYIHWCSKLICGMLP
ncbi:unnamed protein product [Microthlaspi erraticum]|uniref:Uncharacterized protein n=1 Tax=Microthlaspi erraticum TaxID=1685480 RepID=A0A6D2IA78_9BRAS|nr:unnamed protein product [Microthlaspi erraticum]CAA7025155.1 unnamed protein product [Microthlaspi erraticum]